MLRGHPDPALVESHARRLEGIPTVERLPIPSLVVALPGHRQVHEETEGNTPRHDEPSTGGDTERPNHPPNELGLHADPDPRTIHS